MAAMEGKSIEDALLQSAQNQLASAVQGSMAGNLLGKDSAISGALEHINFEDVLHGNVENIVISQARQRMYQLFSI